MRRPNSSFLIAAGISLAVHAGAVGVLWHLAGTSSLRSFVQSGPGEDSEIIREADPLLEREVEPLHEFEMGDAAGVGFAAHDAPAPDEATAREADTDQAFLSLDPPGIGERGKDASVAEATGVGSTPGPLGGSAPPVVAEMRSLANARSLTPFGVHPELTLPRMIRKTSLDSDVPIQSGEATQDAGADQLARAVDAPPKPIAPTAPAPAEPVQFAVKSQPQAAPAPLSSQQAGSPTAGGSDRPAADPARMSDSESDPFSRLGSATYVDGAWRVKFGRKVKTRRPKLLLAGQEALLALQRTAVVLRVDVDATGKVTGVKVLKSSGSNDVDQPTRLSVYDWWFEPKKDAAGNATSDRFEFTIGFL